MNAAANSEDSVERVGLRGERVWNAFSVKFKAAKTHAHLFARAPTRPICHFIKERLYRKEKTNVETDEDKEKERIPEKKDEKRKRTVGFFFFTLFEALTTSTSIYLALIIHAVGVRLIASYPKVSGTNFDLISFLQYSVRREGAQILKYCRPNAPLVHRVRVGIAIERIRPPYAEGSNVASLLERNSCVRFKLRVRIMCTFTRLHFERFAYSRADISTDARCPSVKR